MPRLVIPEILDSLPSDDPEAIRSRRDLRMINFLMGNDHWILKTAARFAEIAVQGISELGAGDGSLTARLARRFPAAAITAFDLAPRPAGLDPRIDWQQGDLFEASKPPGGGILIANLFLHHFEGESLERLGRLCEGFAVVIFCEPARARFPHLLGWLMDPLINRVTRHDMHVSIRAGFTMGELPELLGLTPKRWQIEEDSTWRGASRVLGLRL